MKKIFLFLILFLFGFKTYSQKRSSIWVFGDSTGIDFNGVPSTFNSSMDSRGTSVSIADTSGSLLFYSNTRASVIRSTQVWNNLDQLIQNGDSINGQGWYHELIILPDPGNDSLYYLFSICVTNSCPYGLYYSIINMNANGGLGEVIQKNIPLQSFPIVDCLTAVKHGNGRDWWLIFRRWDDVVFDPNNEFHSYLISPAGITNYNVQTIGETHRAGQGEVVFSPDGSRMINIDGVDLLELFDFNRCSGLLSNSVLIHPAGGPLNYNLTWSSAFSPNGNVLYVSTSKDTNYVYQLDLTASNIYASRLNLDTLYHPTISPGSLKLAPDGKIYLSCAYDNGVQFNYPYKDSVYNYVNMNLSVINYPDSLGIACGYAPFSFYLGGKRTYYGLPNNPDYDLPALASSPCDTLLSLHEPANISTNASLYVYYAPDWEKAFINADRLKGKQYRLRMVDVLGKEVYTESGVLSSQYFTRDLNCASFASGIYLITFETEKERLVKKMQVNWR